MKFVLASKSPRRKELLEKNGYEFDVIPAVGKESVDGSLTPAEVAKAIALKKAEEVFSRTGRITLAADTIVALDGKILLKPADKAENELFLKKLSGRAHEVYTGYAILGGGYSISDVDGARVVFNSLSDELIKAYADSGNGLDKAGGYGIQDGYGLVKEIEGSYTCVMGLPMEKINQAIEGLK